MLGLQRGKLMPKLILNIQKARNIWKDVIRAYRTDALLKLDADFMKAQETNADTTQIVADKQTLRDLPAQVDSATTTDEIKLVWNDMLGDKPTT